jgi:hypothetical protein
MATYMVGWGLLFWLQLLMSKTTGVEYLIIQGCFHPEFQVLICAE